ncbi:GNAT family N-acetyltransferase [Microbacterium sp. NPDC091662]|uniref:GNAT family N-acetyltransferase n=1 Tax=Microbacterium sp. NPDC091662 TaxID=3364211 RepID=UPI003811E55E
MDITLTPPSPIDVKTLYDETGWADHPIETFERALAGSWIVCSAREADGTLLGIGRLIGDGGLHAFVTELIVTERSRGRGIGARILERLVAESRARGVDDIQLFAARGKSSFYEQHGFARRPHDAPGMDVVARG